MFLSEHKPQPSIHHHSVRISWTHEDRRSKKQRHLDVLGFTEDVLSNCSVLTDQWGVDVWPRTSMSGVHLNLTWLESIRDILEMKKCFQTLQQTLCSFFSSKGLVVSLGSLKLFKTEALDETSSRNPVVFVSSVFFWINHDLDDWRTFTVLEPVKVLHLNHESFSHIHTLRLESSDISGSIEDRSLGTDTENTDSFTSS